MGDILRRTRIKHIWRFN